MTALRGSDDPTRRPARRRRPVCSAMLEELRQLGELRDGGILTDAGFEVQKARILAG